MNRQTALLSVYNKDGIVDFANGLVRLGWNLLASGGTAKALLAAELPVRDIATIVGEPILGHRVVTLSREIHAALLARGTSEDIAELERLGIPWIDLVCVDLYPLKEEIARAGSTAESVIEKTDIGGPTMLRSAAKGGRIVICDPKDRSAVLSRLFSHGDLNLAQRRELAGKAEFIVADYCLAAANYLGNNAYGLIGPEGYGGHWTIE